MPKQMHRGTCKVCGGAFWETYKGARGEDLCDTHFGYDDTHAACDLCGDEHPVGVLENGLCPSCCDEEL